MPREGGTRRRHRQYCPCLGRHSQTPPPLSPLRLLAGWWLMDLPLRPALPLVLAVVPLDPLEPLRQGGRGGCCWSDYLGRKAVPAPERRAWRRRQGQRRGQAQGWRVEAGR